MGLLIFGFMWMNSSKQKENQQQQQQEQAEAKKAAADEPQITVDSISAAEAAAIPAAIREGGERSNCVQGVDITIFCPCRNRDKKAKTPTNRFLLFIIITDCTNFSLQFISLVPEVNCPSNDKPPC